MPGGSEIALWALLLLATVTDLVWGKIFNGVTFFFLFAGVAYQFWRAGVPGGTSALFAVAVAFGLFFPLYLMRAFAAGDVKLLMAVGAWSNFKIVVELAMGAILVGALVGGFLLLRQAGFKGSFASLRNHARHTQGRLKSHRMPFAPAFLCAFFVLKIAEMRQWGLL